MRFSGEGIVRSLSLEALHDIRHKNSALNKKLSKYELKMTRSPPSPLDYILVLPKKVYAKIIDRTREKMLFGKQEELMTELKE